ncbi:MAG TPA: DUF1629 domain-containing protein, partial [Polyangiales bacterium]|nr:DUF1629 domain-containing protein [Polyangiales bacterium]
ADPGYWMALRVQGVDADALRLGIPIEDVTVPVRVEIAAQGEGHSDILDLPCLVISNSMRQALERAGVDNVQYFPALLQIEYMEESIDGYWLANVIGTVACVDRERSVFAPRHGSETGELRSFEIDPIESLGLRLFRLADDPRLLVVDQRVRAILEATTLRGLLLQETRTYDGYPASRDPSDPS